MLVSSVFFFTAEKRRDGETAGVKSVNSLAVPHALTHVSTVLRGEKKQSGPASKKCTKPATNNYSIKLNFLTSSVGNLGSFLRSIR